jgi:hypothetical protein
VREDERIEREYMVATQEFERFLSIVSEFADVIDDNKLAGKFVLLEDKSLQTKMIIKKKQMGGAAIEEGTQDEFYPFDDEL